MRIHMLLLYGDFLQSSPVRHSYETPQVYDCYIRPVRKVQGAGSRY